MRYTITRPQDVHARFHTVQHLQGQKPWYNIRPNTKAVFIYEKDSANNLIEGHYGFVTWSEAKGYEGLAYARAETVTEKPTFQYSFMHHRCLVVADGFYAIDEEGQPFYVRMKSRELFGMAGIMNVTKNFRPAPISFAILSIYPNIMIAGIQQRMPAIIHREHEAAYLSSQTSPEEAQALCQPYPDEEMEMYPVTKRVAQASYNSPDFVLTLDELMEKNIQRGKTGTSQMSFFG